MRKISALERVGKFLKSSRLKRNKSLAQVCRPNPHLGHENFSRVEQGVLLDEKVIIQIVEAYHLDDREKRELLQTLKLALEEIRVKLAGERKPVTDRKVRAMPWTPRLGQRSAGYVRA